MSYVKRALVRDSAPIGQPAPLSVACGCGRKVPVVEGAAEVVCPCGFAYDDRGWILRAPGSSS